MYIKNKRESNPFGISFMISYLEPTKNAFYFNIKTLDEIKNKTLVKKIV